MQTVALRTSFRVSSGQFQVGYSKKNHCCSCSPWVHRGGLASLARVDAGTLQTEAFAELPVKKNDKGQALQFSVRRDR